jgi:hypothetical protein
MSQYDGFLAIRCNRSKAHTDSPISIIPYRMVIDTQQTVQLLWTRLGKC